MKNKRRDLFKSRLFFRICGFFLSFLVMCCVFNAPHARATQSGNDFVRDLIPGLRLELTEGLGQEEQSGAVDRDNIDNAFFKVLPYTPRLLFPLNNHLKLFFDLRSTLRDIYERYNNDKKCPTLGINIFF
jgi:hypothetical protein